MYESIHSLKYDFSKYYYKMRYFYIFFKRSAINKIYVLTSIQVNGIVFFITSELFISLDIFYLYVSRIVATPHLIYSVMTLFQLKTIFIVQHHRYCCVSLIFFHLLYIQHGKANTQTTSFLRKH